MTSKIGNERERNKTKWNGTSSKGEKYVSSATDENILGFIILETKIARSQCFFFFFLFFFPLLDTACKPRRNQFNRQIIGIPEPGFSRTDSTRCGSIKLEASPFLSCETRTVRRQVFIQAGRREESPPE